MDTAQYFYRNVIISKNGEKISLINIDKPEDQGQALESWFGVVLQLADGQHTIEELINLVADKYHGAPPGNLNETIYSVIDRLAKLKFIVLTTKATELPYYLSLPYEQLDIEKARKLLEKDKSMTSN